MTQRALQPARQLLPVPQLPSLRVFLQELSLRATSLRVIGPGRAGLSLSCALAAAGWRVEAPLRRGDDLAHAAAGVDLLIIATPDAAVVDVAAAVEPVADTVVAHLAGSLDLDVLGVHRRRASIHPLVSLPDPEVGASRLQGAWFALAGVVCALLIEQSLMGWSPPMQVLRRMGFRKNEEIEQERARLQKAI